MEMIISSVVAPGMASAGNRSAIPFQASIFGLGCLFGFLALSLVISLREFNSFSFQPMLHFLLSTSNEGNEGKISEAEAEAEAESSSAGHNDDRENYGERMARGEVEMVMERLGIFLEGDGNDGDDGIQERLGPGEFGSVFDETEPSFAEIKDAFDLFDENRDGFIDAGELKKVLGKVGLLDFTEGECQRMIMAFDENGDSRVDFAEFLKLVEKSLS